MCGIAGYYTHQNKSSGSDIHAMLRLIAHRGPDDEGFVLSDAETFRMFGGSESCPSIRRTLPELTKETGFTHRIAMGHRRYAILDLSADGHQPMVFRDCILTFNGEVYNYVEVRDELQSRYGMHFSTKSDTEVILGAYSAWGESCFERLNGFFAVVLLDLKKKKLLFARDRVGKAPLYYTVDDSGIYWSSEIKSILEIRPSVRNDINHDAAALFIEHNIRDFDNRTFWNPVKTFPAASFLSIDISSPEPIRMDPKKYWDFPHTRMTVGDISLDDACVQLGGKLLDAIKIRLRSDIPVGFTLSGGLDSSTLAAMYSRNFSTPAHFLSVKNESRSLDESFFAKKVAETYPGSIKIEFIEGLGKELSHELDHYTWLIEEPYHSPVLYTDYCLQKILKHKGYGVMINGAGADELLAGYEYEYYPLFIKYLWRKNPLAAVDELAHIQSKDHCKRNIKAFLALLGVCPARDHRRKRYLNCQSKAVLNYAGDIERLLLDNFGSFKMNYWMRSGNKSYMGIPIEPRMPFLDCNVIEFGFKLPPEYLIHHCWHKYIIRKMMLDALPGEVVWRKVKMGFPFDLTGWLTRKKDMIFRLVSGGIPLVDTGRLMNDFEVLKATDPHLLWRYISILFWYKKMILKQDLVPFG